MKKIIILICLIILCGCSNNKYKALGYTSAEADKILGLSNENQAFFSVYDNKIAAIINNENFVEDNVKTYLKFKDFFDAEELIGLVNNNVISYKNYGYVSEIVKENDYKSENLKLYLTYMKALKGNSEITVKVCNEDKTKYLNVIKELQKDPMFVTDNLDLYLEHKNEKDSTRELVEYVNSFRYLPYYKNQKVADVEKYGYQVLVNKYYCLSEDYEPDDLVNVEAKYGVGRVREEAYEAYVRMQDDAAKEGMSFYICSPYRSYETQYKLYNNYLASDTQENVDIYSARAGSSEHQLGLALDILRYGYDFGNFWSAPEAEWLENNAYKYGFILRYPASKIDITGYKYEPWHFRYVGDIAEDVYKSGVTYEEYFEKYIKTNEGD